MKYQDRSPANLVMAVIYQIKQLLASPVSLYIDRSPIFLNDDTIAVTIHELISFWEDDNIAVII